MREKLSTKTKIIYGSGSFSLSAFGVLRQIYYAIFLTDVVGLDPRLASIGALVGIIWDAINDPLVGIISDRVNSRWGKRLPFLIIFAIPFALSYLILWWAPGWNNQWALLAYVTFAFMATDTIGTLIAVPYSAMTAEMTNDYNERISITSYRMFFQLLASLVAAIAAPLIVDAGLASGLSQQQGYLLVSGIFGSISIIPLLTIPFFVNYAKERRSIESQIAPFTAVMHTWNNVPFRIAALLNMLNWLATDFVALIIPYYLLYWIGQGDLMIQANLFGMQISLEAVVLGVLMLTAMILIPFWNWLGKQLGKRIAYLVGIAPWILAYVGLMLIQPGQLTLMIFIAFIAGIGISSGYVLPEAMFPDVIEWDELQTRRRQEGIYYGIKNFVRKISAALAFSIGLQILGWSGYLTPPEGALHFQQPGSVLLAIRILVGPTGAVLLLGAAVTAWFFPLSRENHGRILRLLERRKSR